jgi:uridylate kinase
MTATTAAALRPRLLKLSGEALEAKEGILDWAIVDRVCAELISGIALGPVAVVVGGGNIMRGAETKSRSNDPTRGDYMGMLATLINSLALKDGIERQGARCEVIAPHAIPNVARQYDRAFVMQCLAQKTIVVFGGGTGHPFFTTDTTAALRAAEIGAAELLKGSKVDGIYNADPKKFPDAKRFDFLTYDEAVAGRYGVMDATAFPICRDHHIVIRVFDMTQPGAIAAALSAHPPGTVVGHARSSHNHQQ